MRPVSTSSPSRSPVVDVQPSRATARYVFGSSMRNRCARLRRPTRTSSSPVAYGSSVPAWPTFVLRGSERRTSSTTSCDVTPAGLARRRTPSTAALGAVELLAHVLPELAHQLWVRHGRREAGRLRMAPAAELARDPRYVDRAVGRPQRHLPHALAVVREQLADQRRHARPLHGAHVVDHALGVGLESAGLLVVALREM